MNVARASSPAIADRVAALNWQGITDELNNLGCATAKSVLSPDECRSVADMYDVEERFRSRILMARHGSAAGISVPEGDFTGGEFVLTEQRPRIQSHAEVIRLQQGDGVIFAVRHRPVQGCTSHKTA